MASVMATGSEVIGECVEGIRVEVRREVLRIALVCPGFFGLALSASLGLLSSCVECSGARYWRVNEVFLWDIKEIKSTATAEALVGMIPQKSNSIKNTTNIFFQSSSTHAFQLLI